MARTVFGWYVLLLQGRTRTKEPLVASRFFAQNGRICKDHYCTRVRNLTSNNNSKDTASLFSSSSSLPQKARRPPRPASFYWARTKMVGRGEKGLFSRACAQLSPMDGNRNMTIWRRRVENEGVSALTKWNYILYFFSPQSVTYCSTCQIYIC